MVNPKSHFFALTALSAAVIGLLLGAAFSFDDSDKIKNTGQISTMRPADVKTVWQSQQKKEETASRENFLKTKQEVDWQPQQVKQDSIAVAAASSLPGNSMEQTKAEQQPNAVPMKSRGVLNGYKGYRHHRPGYKNAGDGWWYPQAAFSSKAVPAANSIQKEKQMKAQAAEREKKAALARQAESAKAKKLAEAKKHTNEKQTITERRAISRHIEWCASHHRSYDPNTNTYRSTFGTKRYCDTPYLHR